MYSVEWTHLALNLLADVWLSAQATERRRITAAIDLIDRLLRERPLDEGESREGERRVTFAAPIGVSFQIDHSLRRVTVLGAWRFNAREQ